jgi:anti-sigma-K factor RskA
MADHSDLAGYVLGALSADERREFEQHLDECPQCRRELDELGRLPALIGRAAPPVEVPAGLRAATLRAVRQEAGAGPAPIARRRASVVEGSTRRLPPAAILATAAIVLAAAGFGARTLTAPRWDRTIRLVSADMVRGSGSARLRAQGGSTLVELNVDLPESSPGTYYECWFVAPDDAIEHPDRISVGTFKVGSSGTTTVRMTTAASLRRFPRMGVTVEPEDGNPARTGPKALAS